MENDHGAADGGGFLGLLDFIVNREPAFWLAVAFGTIAAIVFASFKFGEAAARPLPGHIEADLRPAELTNRPAYHMSFALYVGGLIMIYWLICLIGPAPFQGVVLFKDASMIGQAAFPITAAAILLGVIPKAPLLSNLELYWRQLMHQRAQIPLGLLLLARDLRVGRLDPDRLGPWMREAPEPAARLIPARFLSADPASPEHRLARLCALTTLMSRARDGAFRERIVERGFLERHAALHRKLRDQVAALVDDIARRPPNAPGREIAEAPAERLPEIEARTKDASVILACAARAGTSSQRARELALDELGVVASQTAPQRSTDDADLLIKAVAVGLAVYVAATFAAPFAAPWLPDGMVERGWPDPAAPVVGMGWLLAFALPHLAALFAALIVRSWFRARYDWFPPPTAETRMPALSRYALMGGVGYVVGLVAMTWTSSAVLIDLGASEGLGRGQVFLDELGRHGLDGLVPAASAVLFWRAIDAATADLPNRRRLGVAALHAASVGALNHIGAAHYYGAAAGALDGAMLFGALSSSAYAAGMALTIWAGARRRVVLSKGFGELARL